MTEDIIDCAQRLLVKQDVKKERELSILTRLRDQTYRDLRLFINKRNKVPWRTWDPKGTYYKPDIENTGLNLLQL